MYFQLKTQQRKNKIPAQLPEGVGTANKTGELDTVENDAAIIYDTAKGIDLVVCFMSQDLTDTGAAQSTMLQMHALSTDIIMNKHYLLNLQSIQIIVINQIDIHS